MLRLRKILLYDKLYIIIFLTVITITLIRIYIPKKSNYSSKDRYVIGYITKINKNNIEIKSKEKIIVYTNKKYNYKLGDKIEIEGEFIKPNNNTTKYLFNYKKYLERKNIFYIIKPNNIKLISKNKKIYYKIKQLIINHLGNNPYLYTFIIGDKSLIEKEVQNSYQENGISHLFAISGMHITLLSSIIMKLLKKYFNEEKVFKITSIILSLYLLFVGLSPSILRGVLFYILFGINKVYYFYVKPTNIFLFILSISLMINPNYIFDIGFLYSFLISLTLIIKSKSISSTNYFISLLKVSLISFISSIPISLYNFSQINILSILYNVVFVPYISIIVFPLTLLVFLIKPLLPVYNLLITILEKTSLMISDITIGKLVFKRLSIYVYLVYFILFIIYLITTKKEILMFYFILIFIHFLIPYISKANFITIIDVGQGDAILMHLDNKNILIDTGTSYEEGNLFYNILYPYFKTRGIKKINTLIITHGDKDHMGEAKTLVSKMKVDKVIFNIGKYNYLEKDLIKKLKTKKIKYYKDIDEIKLKNTKLLFLSTSDYNNENNNSNVIYFELKNTKFLFMGDAGIEREKDIIDEYNLEDIDFVKIGHHGSNTSSNKKFIDNIKPKNCLISVGKNNRYGHPKESVIDILDDYCDIYRTDLNGSIEIKLNKNNYKIKTYNS